MKKADYKTSLCQAFTALAFIGTLSACVEEDVADNVWKPKGEELVVLPAVSESPVQRVATRAASVEELKEKELNTLDVFVQHVGESTFLKQYHLRSLADKNIVESGLNWLADRWRKEGLVMGEQYNIYVAANNRKTNTDVDGVDALKALAYSEVEDNVAVVDETSKNITWGTDGTSGNIYKLYAETPGDYRALTSEKQFMMDGVINNWTPNPSTLTQEFDVTLNRAAAKIVVNVNFDADFLKSLTKDKDGKEKADKDKLFITGSPAWRFYNFAFGAPVFDPGTNFTPVEVHNSDFNIFHNQPFEGDDKHFQIVTYTYPNKWDEANYATAAPSLVISVPFSQYKNIGADGHHTDDEMTTTYNYFRIPIVAHTTTSVDRNHIYVVNATLATRGSMSLEDEDVIEDVVYNVLPWNDESNSAVIKNEVEAIQHYYLKVNPKVYTLRGDGQQEVIINYLKAAGTKVNWKLFQINTATGEKGAAVESTASNAVWGWFYDKNGDMKTSLSNDGSGINWNHMGVTIEQSNEGTSGSNGTIKVTSTALNNRAIKYILLRVYLDETNEDGVSLENTYYEDILIRHFPTDNIQSIEGSWSSYHSGSATIREYSFDPVADGWEAGSYQSEYIDVVTDESATPADYLAGNAQRVDYSDRLEMDGYYQYDYNWYTYRQIWTSYVPQASRQGANSEANAYGPTDDGFYFWGEGSDNSRTYNNDYDWIQGTGNARFYRYRYFYYSKYVMTEQRLRYYRDVESSAVTGNWVDWERDAGQTGTAKYDQRGDDPSCVNDSYHAHIFSNGTVHYLNSTYNDNASIGNSYGASYSNNHMYVVQISSTSDKYVLGKPVLGNPDANRSLDEVASPAFMIASQLGIVTNTGWNSALAAEHCSRYMEVAEDGTRYIGWRLPTAMEIEIIRDYQGGRFGNITIPQNDRVMDNVLKGQYYYNLSGGSTASNYSGGSSGTFLRCIRDLSAEEIKKLNGFEELQEKYQTKN